MSGIGGEDEIPELPGSGSRRGRTPGLGAAGDAAGMASGGNVPGLGSGGGGVPGVGGEDGVPGAKGAGKRILGAMADDGGESEEESDPSKKAGAGGPELGAAGTSAAAKGDSEEGKGKGGGAGKGMGAATVAPAVNMASQLMVLLKFLKWLKGMVTSMVASAINLLQMVAFWATVAVKFAVGAALVLGGIVAAALGGGVIAGAIMGVGAVLMVFAVIAMVAVGVAGEGNTAAQHDGSVDDCRPQAEAVVSEIDDNYQSGSDSDSMDEMAEQIYAVLSGMGMRDENIAGVLGNFEQESYIDPTTVETIYNERYRVGPRTKDAEEKGFKVELIDAGYAADWPAIDLVGIGLGQWTNGRNSMLTDYADKVDGEWYELETQLSFMVTDDDPTRVRFVKSFIEDSDNSIRQATEDWMVKWEGLTLDNSVNQPRLESRYQNSRVWFSKMKSWEADEELADSILEQASMSVSNANQNRRDAAIQECRTASTGGGSVVQAGDTVPCDSLGRMHPDACDMHKFLQDEFGGFFLTAGGQRNEPSSNHHNGQAIDYMMAPLNKVPSAEMRRSGDTIVNFVIANSEELNISGILWNERKWAAGNDPIGEWNEENTRYAGGRGSNTQNHVDHVHISVGPDPFK
ncbi:phage tail tip lysozyme [Nocardiopsis eucommiae]|uniref:phage tail tip lysozyme n=1 Tax=Nocardiopsis eucommiae TaxID=2831970 RepID=UPI003D7081C4